MIYMPNCKNDASRKYKGTEPSPKRGFAHAEKVGLLKSK